MSAHEDPQHGNHQVRFEPTDVSSKPIVYSVVSLALFTIVFTAVAHLVFGALAERQRVASAPASPLAEQYGAKQPPSPRLQEHPKRDLDTLRAAEDKVLSGYAWVDKGAGVVQVPIERAMEMLLARGLPARQAPVPAKMSPRGVAPSQAPEGSGAPDWIGAPEGGHSEQSGKGSGAAGEPAPGKRGH